MSFFRYNTNIEGIFFQSVIIAGISGNPCKYITYVKMLADSRKLQYFEILERKFGKDNVVISQMREYIKANNIIDKPKTKIKGISKVIDPSINYFVSILSQNKGTADTTCLVLEQTEIFNIFMSAYTDKE